MKLAIEKVKDIEKDEKGRIVEEVLLDLPEWFGLPESTKAYIEEAKELPLWVAKIDDDVLGFITLKETSDVCGEIHCMGVKKKFHHMGLGEKLFKALEKETKKSLTYLQVKTVDEGHYIEYDGTLLFYKKMGFSKLEVFPTLWDPWNPCLILVKKIAES